MSTRPERDDLPHRHGTGAGNTGPFRITRPDEADDSCPQVGTPHAATSSDPDAGADSTTDATAAPGDARVPSVEPPSEESIDLTSILALQMKAATESGSETHGLAKRMNSVLAPCQDLLEEALDKIGASAGVLYGVESPRQLSLLGISGITGDGNEPVIERAAIAGLEASRPLVTAGRPDVMDCERFLVVPCFLQGDVTAVLMVGRTVQDTVFVEQALAKLGSTTSLALAADRARIHFTLERRLAEAEGMRRQLDAYALDLRSVYLSERARSEELGRTLVELEETYEATVRGLAIAVEAKDEYTGGHLFRVSQYGMAMTAVVAPAHRDDPQFEYGFLLHDVGKLSVPDAILAKSGALTEDEWDHIRAHPESGRTILERIPFLAGASEIVYCHHERWDGKGFPRGLSGDEIPLGARIFPIADAFDAMTTSRPYRKAMPIEIARVELLRGSGSQFWPEAVDAFMSMPISDLEEIRRRTLGASGW